MKIDEIVTLIQAVSEHGLTSFEYMEGDQKLVLKKKEKNLAALSMGPAAAAVPVSGAALTSITNDGMEQKGKKQDEIHSDKVVLSPLVGTFYASSSPGTEPFIKIGDHVKKGQVLGIIEAMKLMNEIESEYDGIVEDILVENESIVEYGQPMFRIR